MYIFIPSFWPLAGIRQQSAAWTLSFVEHGLISTFNGFNGLHQSLTERMLLINNWEYKLVDPILIIALNQLMPELQRYLCKSIYESSYTFHYILSLCSCVYTCYGESTQTLLFLLVCSSHFILVPFTICNEILRDDTAL